MAKTEHGRVAYADLLRTLAMLAVIVVHLSGGWLESLPVGSFDWNVLNLWDGLARWCVPMFVMLSGMFLLDPKKSLPLSGLLLRIARLIVALLVWGSFYALLDRWPGWRGLSPRFLLSILRAVLRGETAYHLWFVYLIVGLYLVTPILRAFVRGASRGDLHWFLLLAFLFATLLPILLRLYPSAMVSLYLYRLDLHVMMGYAGYFVAGYYLKTYTLGRVAELIIYLLGAAGAIATVWGTARLSAAQGSLNDLLYLYLSPNVAAMSVAVFVLFRYLLGVSDERSRRAHLAGTARISFGIYLVHVFFIMLLRRFGLSTLPVTPALAIPLLTAAVLLPSWLTAWLLSKIPFLGPYLT